MLSFLSAWSSRARITSSLGNEKYESVMKKPTNMTVITFSLSGAGCGAR